MSSSQGYPDSGGAPVVAGSQALASLAFADPTAAGVTVTQPDGGVALDQQDSRITQLSYSNGMLWAGALAGAPPLPRPQKHSLPFQGRSCSGCMGCAEQNASGLRGRMHALLQGAMTAGLSRFWCAADVGAARVT